MSDLRELYQQVIIDHSRHPRNCKAMEHATCSMDGFNPLCGDKVKLYLKLNGDKIEDLSFEGSGCAISTASVSMLTEMLKGKTKTEALTLFEKFHTLVTGESNEKDNETLGKLMVFKGVQEFPMRVKCATLSWHTLKAALENKQEPVSTE